jgi:hypothetical protein
MPRVRDHHPTTTILMNEDIHITKSLRIWQQNVNKSLEAQLDMLHTVSPLEYDIIAVQEPYLDHNKMSRGNTHWTIVYPPNHQSLSTRTRSILLVNIYIDLNAWYSLEVLSPDITAICITSATIETFLLYNIYNDQDHSESIQLLTQHTSTTRSMLQHRHHILWMGDFNCHSPIWDDPKNTQLFTCRHLDDAQILINATSCLGLDMLLPAKILTWRLGSTRHKRAAEGHDDKVIGSLRHLPISKTLMQSTSPVKTKYISNK